MVPDAGKILWLSTYANPAAESRVQTTARNIASNATPGWPIQQYIHNIPGSTCPRVPETTMFGPLEGIMSRMRIP